MCILHKWGEWHEVNYNHYPYVLPKKEERECDNCRKTEVRALPSLEKRIFSVYKNGVSKKEIETALQGLICDYGKMRYDYCARTLVEEVIGGRK